MKGLFLAATAPARRKLTKDRRRSDATFELLFANNPLPLWVYDLETLRFLDVNEVACHRYGYSREEFLALTMRDIRPPEDIPRMHTSVRASATSGSPRAAWKDIHGEMVCSGACMICLYRFDTASQEGLHELAFRRRVETPSSWHHPAPGGLTWPIEVWR